jgi:hypothetical protein
VACFGQRSGAVPSFDMATGDHHDDRLERLIEKKHRGIPSHKDKIPVVAALQRPRQTTAAKSPRQDFLTAIRMHGRPVADIEERYISTASRILANLCAGRIVSRGCIPSRRDNVFAWR